MKLSIILLADESVDARIIHRLRAKGIIIEAISELAPGVDDSMVLRIALERDATLLTEDKDFGELTYRLRKSSCGIVLIRMSGVPIEEKINVIERLLRQYGDRLHSSFCVVTANKIRVTTLRR